MKRRWCLAGVIAACVACNDESPAGGLMLMVVQDGSLEPDSLRLEVAPPGSVDSKPQVWEIPKNARLPATVALNWTKASSPEITLDASLWSGETRLDQREFTLTRIPTRHYAAVPILFGARCASTSLDVDSATCASGRTCDPRDGSCVSQRVDASELPVFEPGMEQTITWDPPQDTTGVTVGDSGGTTATTTIDAGTGDGGRTETTFASSEASRSSTVDVSSIGASGEESRGTQSSNPVGSGTSGNSVTGENTGAASTHSSEGGDTSFAMTDPTDTVSASNPTSHESDAGASCDPGEYWDSSECMSWRTCSPGSYILIEGTPTADRVCETCPDGQFSSQPDALSCAPFTPCGFREVLETGSPTTDALCSSADVVLQFGGDDADTAAALALDTNEALYSVGSSRGALTQDATNAGGWDAFIQKRNSTGALLWSRQFGTSSYDRAYGVVANGDGDVTVTGYTEGSLASGGGAFADIFLRRYGPDGDVRWTSQYGTPNLDMPYGVIETREGNLVVTGRTYGSFSAVNAGEADFFVTQFDSQGAHVWSQQIGTSGNDWGFALALDPFDEIVAVGHVSGGFGGTDVALLKLTPDGVVSWQTSFGSNADDGAAAVATDDEGYIYVAGYTYGRLGSEDPQGVDAWVSKRKPDGTLVWIRQFGTDGADGAQSIALHGNRVYVAGYWGSGENFTSYDIFVRSYALDGTDPRSRTLGTSEDEYALGMAVTNARVFVSGDTSGPFGATNAGEYDAFVAQVVMP